MVAIVSRLSIMESDPLNLLESRLNLLESESLVARLIFYESE